MRRRDAETGNRYVTLPHKALQLTLADDDRAEELRVLYVAMTRAREKLCLSMALERPERVLSSLASLLDGQPVIPSSTVRSASSMGSWLLSALLRHPAAGELRRLAGREDLPTLSDDTPFRIVVCRPNMTDAVATTPEPADASPNEALIARLREHMAYRYPYEALARIPAKLAASDTAHGTLPWRFAATARPACLSAAGMTPAQRGIAMHTFMQFASYEQAADDPEREIARLVRAQFLTEEQAAVLDRARLKAFFDSALYRRMRASPRCLREVPFTALRPATSVAGGEAVAEEEQLVTQGMADCLFEENGHLVVVDYKTDRVRTPQELIDRYRGQIAIYREALGEALGMPVTEAVLYSFVLNRAIPVEP